MKQTTKFTVLFFLLIVSANVSAQRDTMSHFSFDIRFASGVNFYRNAIEHGHEYDPEPGVNFQLQSYFGYSFKHISISTGLRIGQRRGQTYLSSAESKFRISVREKLLFEVPVIVSYTFKNHSQQPIVLVKGGVLAGSSYIQYGGNRTSGTNRQMAMVLEGLFENTNYSSLLIGVDKEVSLLKGNKIVLGIEYSQQFFIEKNRELVISSQPEPTITFKPFSHSVMITGGFKF